MTYGSREIQDECDITIFIACYNEERGIIASLETVLAALKEVRCTYDIIVIDDASADRSVELVRNFMDEHPQEPITLYVNESNQGLGANFAEGAFRGRGKYYRLVCGDNVESRKTLVAALRHLGEADIIMTYPVEVQGRSWFRRVVSGAYTQLVNFLGGHRIRYYNGLSINLRYNVMRWHSNSHGFGFQADLITRLLDLDASYIEVPVIQEERAGGSSKAFTFRNICSVGHSVLEILIRRVAKFVHPHATGRPSGTIAVFRAKEPEVRDRVAKSRGEQRQN